MSFLRAALVIAIAAPCGPAVSSPWDAGRAAEAIGELLNRGFNRRESAHFVAIFDVRADTVDAYLAEAEAVYAAVDGFRREWGFAPRESCGPLRVVIFDRRDGYRTFAEVFGEGLDDRPGFHHPGADIAVFQNARSTPEFVQLERAIAALATQLDERADAGERGRAPVAERSRKMLAGLRADRDRLVDLFNRFVLRHEIAHQVLYAFGVHSRQASQPPWLVEGLAAQFEIPQRGRGGRLAVNPWRLADFLEAAGLGRADGGESPGSANATVEPGKLIPAARLVRDADLVSAEGADLQLLYAESWALVFYLHRSAPEAFGGYLRRMAEPAADGAEPGDRRLADFESFFGPLDDSFHARWIAAMQELDSESTPP